MPTQKLGEKSIVLEATEILTLSGARAIGGGVGTLTMHNLLSTPHNDTLAATVVAGDIIVGNVTPAWSRLAITAPAAGLMNYLGAANGDTAPAYKALFDATVPTTIAESASAATGTATVAARRDHAHGAPATWAATAHNLLSATHGDVTAAACVRGDVVTGQGASPKWVRLAITAPAAGLMNYLGAANGDIEPAYKALFDATVPTTIAENASAATGTATVAARRDHAHGAPATWAATAHNLLSATHGDATAAACVRGDVVTGQGASPKWVRLAITAPAAGLMNYLGAANGDTEPAYKALFDATVPTTIAESASAATGTATVAARRDHAHGAPATWAATAHTIDGATHTVSGRTAGQVLIATAATTFGWSVFKLTGTSGGTTTLAVTNAKTLTLIAADDYNVTVPATGTLALLGTANLFTANNTFDTNTLFIDAANHKVGIGTITIPHGAVGAALLALEGTNASEAAGPHIQITTASDNYPLFSLVSYAHDNINLCFDSYLGTGWKSSDAGSCFRIAKVSDILNFDYGVAAAGAALTWANAIQISNTGTVSIPSLISSQEGLTFKATTPATLTGNVNNYNPGAGSCFRISSDDNSRTITGIAGGTDGRVIIMFNVGSYEIILKDSSTSSDAANRMILYNLGDLVLGTTSNNSVFLVYDATISRWQRIIQTRV